MDDAHWKEYAAAHGGKYMVKKITNNKSMRKIRDEEKRIIEFLLTMIGAKLENYPVSETVYEYEGGVMGSISMQNTDGSTYLKDLIQAHYIDVDLVPVVITLTADKDEKLLDLDFWKEDFSKLIQYPTPDKLKVNIIGNGKFEARV